MTAPDVVASDMPAPWRLSWLTVPPATGPKVMVSPASKVRLPISVTLGVRTGPFREMVPKFAKVVQPVEANAGSPPLVSAAKPASGAINPENRRA